MSEATNVLPLASRLERIVEDRRFKRTILVLIVINAVLLGLETSRTLSVSTMNSIIFVNQVILGIFVVELILRIGAYRLNFFRDSWSVFDFAIVTIALIAPSGAFQVVRALRILRAFRLVSTVTSLRRVVEGLLGAIPGIASVLFLLVLVLYIAGVMFTILFRDVAPDNFGHLGISLFSLFQIMTLEGWAEIATGVMEDYEWAWVFFIGYILVATFLVLNLVIGVVVSSIQSRIESESATSSAAENELVMNELREIREEVRLLREESRSRQP
jgi:voltage-gated sodium channel